MQYRPQTRFAFSRQTGEVWQLAESPLVACNHSVSTPNLITEALRCRALLRFRARLVPNYSGASLRLGSLD
jgi:hypothetical protein